jgi:hypothetical protein
MAGRFGGAEPGGVWIVGEIVGDSCRFRFPDPGGEKIPNVLYVGDDVTEPALSLFDELGVKVWLQVEPGDAEISTLIDIVLGRYGSHPSVIGFGLDVEWLEVSAVDIGRAVTDEEAEQWVEQIRGYNPEYTLMLKHWLSEKMPPSYREGIFFINDGQNVPTQAELVAAFRNWGTHFAGNSVGFQIGYSPDQAWWGELADPPRDLGAAIVNEIPNTRGLFWVDFTVDQIFPRD